MQPNIQILLYLGTTLIGDVNKYSNDRSLSESLKSEQTTATADQFSFSINWHQFQNFVATKFDDDPVTFLRVGKTRVVVIDNDIIRFSGFLASKPGRSGNGSEQFIILRFFEHFARLSGDIVSNPSDKKNPLRVFTDRPAHLYVQDLINEYMARAATAGETLNWIYGTVNTLGNKTVTYKDFQTVSKVLCDAMNNTTGAGKFDVVFRADPTNYSRQIIDILKPRGKDKNIIIKYPSDGVYKLWSSDYEIEETNDYASEVVVTGNGQVGDPAIGEMTANLSTKSNASFVSEYCYWRTYDTQSNLGSQTAVDDYANKLLSQLAFTLQVPKISLVGRPIAWGDATNEDNGLAIGDSFYFKEESDDGSDQSGQFRIIGMDTTWDKLGVATVKPTLMRIQ